MIITGCTGNSTVSSDNDDDDDMYILHEVNRIGIDEYYVDVEEEEEEQTEPPPLGSRPGIRGEDHDKFRLPRYDWRGPSKIFMIVLGG